MIQKNKYIIIFLLFTLQSIAQNKNSVIKYRAEINPKYVDSFITALEQKEEVPMHIKQKVTENYFNAKPDTFTLNIKNNESFYYYTTVLVEEGTFNVGSLANRSSFYVNSNEDVIIENSKYLGYTAHQPLAWRITRNKKKIGAYICFKAIASEKLYSRKGFTYNRQVIAWFTPGIPLPFGPSNYVGLPGLVIEVQRDKFTITATELKFNIDEEVKIEKPDKNAKIKTPEQTYNLINELEEQRKN